MIRRMIILKCRVRSNHHHFQYNSLKHLHSTKKYEFSFLTCKEKTKVKINLGYLNENYQKMGGGEIVKHTHHSLSEGNISWGIPFNFQQQSQL